MNDIDFALALSLQQEELDKDEVRHADHPPTQTYYATGPPSSKTRSVVDPDWELVDPTPDVLALFQEFNKTYFWGKLNMVEVKWSKRMTLCAGLCRYEGYGGLCSIALSQPLLKLRPRSDLVETLLHEMIHAYLFVTRNNRDHDAHGPEFCKHMKRINGIAGCNITIYHSFHDEVNEMRKHWWRCQGPCQSRPPYFGYVKRAMNRAPSSNDTWWGEHQRSCGGKYVKIKEPDDYRKKATKSANKNSNSPAIDKFFKQNETKAVPKSAGVTKAYSARSGVGTGNKLGGATANVNGRGIPSTSRLLTTRTSNVQTPPQNSSPKTEISKKPSEVKSKDNAVHDKWNTLLKVKKREGSGNAVPVKRKKKKSNLYDFFQRLKTSGRKSVSSGAPAFKMTAPIVSFSKRAIYFSDSEDEDSDKENKNLPGTLTDQKKEPVETEKHPHPNQRDLVAHPTESKIKTENIKVEREKSSRIATAPHQTETKIKSKNAPVKIERYTDEDDWLLEGVTIDLSDLSDDDILLDEYEHASQKSNTASAPTSNTHSSTAAESNTPVHVKQEAKVTPGKLFPSTTRNVNLNGGLSQRKSPLSRRRLPSFSDDDDDVTLTQVWQSHKDPKKIKFEKDLDHLHSKDSDLPDRNISGIDASTVSPSKTAIRETSAKFSDELVSPKKESRTDAYEFCDSTSSVNRKTESVVLDNVPKLSDPSEDSSDIVRVSCPICNASFPIEFINSHVDDCLLSEEPHSSTSAPPRDNANKSTYLDEHDIPSTSKHCDTGVIVRTGNFQAKELSEPGCESNSGPQPSSSENAAESSRLPCPICGTLCPADKINDHIDDCLSVKAISESNWD